VNTPASGPVTSTDRIVSIDVLRGFALLGILVVNIQSFSMIQAAYFNPTAYGDFSGANFVVWLLTYVLFDQKFMTIFSMLFGAGIVLMAERAEAAGTRPARLHYRRMLWLVLFGILHGYLLWYGEILYVYGMCGLAAYAFRKARPSVLLVTGILMIAVVSVLWLFFGWSMQFWPEPQMAEFSKDWRPNAEVVAAEVEIYRSGWLGQMAHRVPATLEFQTFIFLIWGVWRAGGLMLVGMALHKLGVFSAGRSARAYLIMAAIGLAVGLTLVIYGVTRQFEAGWNVEYSFFFGTQFNYWGSLAVSLGWVALIMLWCRASLLEPLKRALAAVGRMALSNYLIHTIVCTTIFYGHGFGLFGRIERVGQAAIVLTICVVQLVASPLWLRRFRFGPFEWVWRSLTYLRPQPMRRS